VTGATNDRLPPRSAVAFLCPRFDPDNTGGGIERHVREVGVRLARRGVAVRIVTISKGPARLTEGGVEIPIERRRPIRRFGLVAPSTALATRRSWRAGERVLVQYPQLGLGVPADDRLTVTVHSTLERESRSRAGERGGRSRIRDALRRTLGVALERRVLRRARRVVAVGAHLRPELEDVYGVSPERIHVVHNGVDCERFVPRLRQGEEGDDDNRPLRAITVGRVVRRKRIDVLLEAMARANVPVELRVVGEGGDRKRLLSLARRLGVEDRVVFTGARDGEPLAEEYRRAEVFLFPTLVEGATAPLALLESMACGTPAVAAPYEGASEAVPEGAGWVLDDGSPDAFARALERAAANRIRLEEMGRMARERVVGEYSWEHTVDRLMDVYALVSR